MLPAPKGMQEKKKRALKHAMYEGNNSVTQWREKKRDAQRKAKLLEISMGQEENTTEIVSSAKEY